MSVKATIPKALREQVWLKHVGKVYSAKCRIVWCRNTMTVFDFQSGHDVPESKGGATNIENLIPICSRCNLSMSNTYTIHQWNQLSQPIPFWKRWWCATKNVQSDITASGTKSRPNPSNQNAKPSKSHGECSKEKRKPKPTETGTK